MFATATATTLPGPFIPAPINAAVRTLPRIAVIDDDPIFGKMMVRLGRKLGVLVQHFEDVDDVRTLAGFDVAIVDAGCPVERLAGALPIILVSRKKLPKDRIWPRYVKDFVYKGLGPYAVLDAALEAHGLSTFS